MTLLRVKSASVRPASTAERAVGRDRNRSMTPLMRSLCSPYAVVLAPKTANWARMPGMSQLT